MKKLNLLCFATFLSLFAIIFAGCSKDSLSENTSSQSNSNKPGQVSRTAPSSDEEPGSIQAAIRAEYWSMSMYVYSDTYTSGEYLPDQDGIIHIDSLAAGTYTVVLHPYNDNSDLAEIRVTDIEVLPGETTYLEKGPL